MPVQLSTLRDAIVTNNTVDQSLYPKFEVKRGLRNADGSGVLAGLTNISSVVGFHKIEGDMVPVDGVLRYRGVSIDELISTIKPTDRYGFERVSFLLLVGKLPTDDEFEVFF